MSGFGCDHTGSNRLDQLKVADSQLLRGEADLLVSRIIVELVGSEGSGVAFIARDEVFFLPALFLVDGTLVDHVAAVAPKESRGVRRVEMLTKFGGGHPDPLQTGPARDDARGGLEGVDGLEREGGGAGAGGAGGGADEAFTIPAGGT